MTELDVSPRYRTRLGSDVELSSAGQFVPSPSIVQRKRIARLRFHTISLGRRGQEHVSPFSSEDFAYMPDAIIYTRNGRPRLSTFLLLCSG